MSTRIKLQWEHLLESCNRGEFEPQDSRGKTEFMYCPKQNRFISDPTLLEQIRRARSNKHPFMLIGELGTGKNIFLELVARGDPQGETAVECIDANVGAPTEEQLEKFFGPGGIVESNPSALIHFDFLQNAIDWDPFLDRLLELAKNHKLVRTDGSVVANLGVRVAGGATCELQPLLAKKPDSLFHYIYRYLCPSEPFRTYPLSERTSRLEFLLAEIMVDQVLDEETSTEEQAVKFIEDVSEDELRTLKEHSWPGGFFELRALVRNAILTKSWKDAIAEIKNPSIPPKVFVSYSWDDEGHKEWVRQLGERLRADGADMILDQWHTVPGDQLPEFMESGVRESQFILIVCTPNYKRKSNERLGGVGYEGTVMTAEVVVHANHRKFIPILRRGKWSDAAPSWLSGKKYIDFSGDPYAEENYNQLLQVLHGLLPAAPPLGPVPDKSRFARQGASPQNAPPSSTSTQGAPRKTSLDQLPLSEQILIELYDLWLQDPKNRPDGERFYGMGDKDDVDEAILELRDKSFISHGEPIRTGVMQEIRRIPAIKINANGKATAQAIKQSLN